MSRPAPRLPLLIALVTFGPISTDLYLPSLPDMTRAFATDVSMVQLTLSVFIAGFAAAQLVYGPLSDCLGRRPVLLGGVAVYLLASVVCVFATGIEMLILGRFLQALGACAGPVLGRAIVRDVYPRDQAARVMASMASVMALAPAAAPMLGGAVHAAFGWRANFVLLVVFGVGLLIAAWALLGETNAHRDPHALRFRRMLGNYALLLGDGAFVGTTLTLSFIFAGMFSYISGVSFVLIDVLGVRPENFGFCFAAVIAGYIAGSVAATHLSLRLGSARMISLGVGLGLVAGLTLGGLALAKVQTIAAVIAPMSVILFAAALALPNATATAIAPHARIAGSASALLGFIQMAVASAAGWLVGRLHDDTTLPMAGVIAAALVAAAMTHLLTLSRRAS